MFVFASESKSKGLISFFFNADAAIWANFFGSMRNQNVDLDDSGTRMSLISASDI